MVEGKGSSLVHLLVIVLSLTAFGFSIAAERCCSSMPQMYTPGWLQVLHPRNLYFEAPKLEMGILHKDDATNQTYCVYHSNVATGYGVGAFLFLLSSESLLMGVTKCMCFGRPLSPGSNRAWTIIYFISSWMTFIVAEACLIAGAKRNAYHTQYRNMIYANNFSCESLRKGIFIAGAVFVIATMVLNVYFYMYFTKATTLPAKKINHSSSGVGMTGRV